MSELTAGQKAPDFTLPTDQGSEVSLQGLLEESEKEPLFISIPRLPPRAVPLRLVISGTH